MINVLHLLNHAGKAGSENYVYTLIDQLADHKIKAYFGYNEDGLLVQRLQKRGIHTFQFMMKHPFDLSAAIQLAAFCREKNIQLIHTHFLRENYIALLSRCFNPRVKVVHTNHMILSNNAIMRMTNRLLSPLLYKAIAVCTPGRDMLIRNGIAKKKITVIFNGVDPKDYAQPVPSSIGEEFGIPEDAFVFLCASRFSAEKGHQFLLNAIPMVKEKTDKPFVLLLGGDGPLLEDAKAQAKELDINRQLIFAGFRSNIRELFAVSHVLINASESEALSYLNLEGLASGLPLIATSVGGNTDIINQENNCGILVEYNNPSSMAEAMVQLMSNPALMKNLSKNARQVVKTRFNLRHIINQIYRIYLESYS